MKGEPNCLYEFKRILGLGFNDPLTQYYMRNWPFKVGDSAGDNIPRFIVDLEEDRAEFTAADMYAVFIGYFKDLAERKSGHTISHVVITVPAHFNDIQRRQVKEAAESLNLTVIQLVNEPTAAALAYSVDHDLNHKKVLVYDIGGGTFDVTVMNIDNKYEVLSSKGDIHLGGADFTLSMERLMEDTIRSQQGPNYQFSDKQKKKLMKLAEKVKVELSGPGMTSVDVEGSDIGDDVMNFNITRTMFEGSIMEELQRARSTVTEALNAAHLRAEDIDEIVLIGGSSLIPKIKEDMWEFFHREPLQTINPHTAVANGALYLAAIKGGYVASARLFPEEVAERVKGEYVASQEQQADSILPPIPEPPMLIPPTPMPIPPTPMPIPTPPMPLTDAFIGEGVVPDSYVLEQANDTVYRLITAGVPFGAKRDVQLETAEDNAQEITIRIAQGNNEQYSKNTYYCRLSIKDIPVLPKGEVKVVLTMTVNKNGFVDFTAITDEGQPAEIEMNNPLISNSDTIRNNRVRIKNILEENKFKAQRRKYNKELMKWEKNASQGKVNPALQALLEEERQWSQQLHTAEEYRERRASLEVKAEELVKGGKGPVGPILPPPPPPVPIGQDQGRYVPPPPPPPIPKPIEQDQDSLIPPPPPPIPEPTGQDQDSFVPPPPPIIPEPIEQDQDTYVPLPPPILESFVPPVPDMPPPPPMDGDINDIPLPPMY